MKIAITAQEPSPDSQIDSRFGRAPWLMIFDPTNNSWQSIDNSAGLNAAHGAGIQAAQKVVDQQATAIITGAIGPKAYRSLQAEYKFSMGPRVLLLKLYRPFKPVTLTKLTLTTPPAAFK
jgi:predicted Fe-Mo cluster-binding NifX family protein